MRRLERLAEIERRIRRAGGVTSDALAAELGVSRRTILRDVATLREQGLPIDADAGRGGGLRLDAARDHVAVRLGVTEIAALWLAASLSSRATALPWAERARAALRKLGDGLPRAKAARLADLCRRVVVGPPVSAAVAADAGPTTSEVLQAFEAAFGDGIGLSFEYRDREGRTTHRRVEPHGLLVQPPVWYVLARDLDRLAPRMFRMDRMSRPRLVHSARFVPDVASVLDPSLPETFAPLVPARR